MGLSFILSPQHTHDSMTDTCRFQVVTWLWKCGPFFYIGIINSFLHGTLFLCSVCTSSSVTPPLFPPPSRHYGKGPMSLWCWRHPTPSFLITPTVVQLWDLFVSMPPNRHLVSASWQNETSESLQKTNHSIICVSLSSTAFMIQAFILFISVHLQKQATIWCCFSSSLMAQQFASHIKTCSPSYVLSGQMSHDWKF